MGETDKQQQDFFKNISLDLEVIFEMWSSGKIVNVRLNLGQIDMPGSGTKVSPLVSKSILSSASSTPERFVTVAASKHIGLFALE